MAKKYRFTIKKAWYDEKKGKNRTILQSDKLKKIKEYWQIKNLSYPLYYVYDNKEGLILTMEENENGK